jgi:hypothetical protein
MSSYITKRSEELQKPIVNAREPLVLQVKDIDVNMAQERNSKCCAFVRACERQLAIEAAFFFRTTAYLEYEDKLVKYQLPQSVQKEIVSFDRSKIMQPGVYQLSKPFKSTSPAAVKKRDARKPKGRHPGRGDGPIKRKVLIHRTQGVRTMSEPSYRAGKS